jgi:hypothetical protein
MPNGTHGQKTAAPKSKKLPRQRPVDAVSRSVRRQATNQEVGDTADRITRAPRKTERMKITHACVKMVEDMLGWWGGGVDASEIGAAGRVAVTNAKRTNSH